MAEGTQEGFQLPLEDPGQSRSVNANISVRAKYMLVNSPEIIFFKELGGDELKGAAYVLRYRKGRSRALGSC